MAIIISYRPAWKTMKQKKITQYNLLAMGINNRVLNALKHNKNLTVLTIEKLCKALDCTPNEIVEFIDDHK